MDRFRGGRSRARDHHFGHSVESRRVRAGTVGVEIQGTCSSREFPVCQILQSALALLLHSRANLMLRVIRFDLVRHVAERHNESIWTCLCQILGVHNDESDAVAKQTATLPQFAPVFLLRPVGGLLGHDQ